MMMTVQDLIDELQKVEDKTKKVKVYERWSDDWTSDIDIVEYEKEVRLD
jgi:7,8-dihydro-6-hydroxymethylpterin-pyrophosphokinase